ncbi:Nicotinate nucleotide adenylyltransferase family protein [Elusimicrobium minutum Pei191]|uniref:Probable nicotinate-nucleotide adenylyltransferase n=1 Tax=Elusimicrobium minutum (strain Pei191) TaxID=445932 RepID=B2KD53_ELUMP|nr:nicotinate-nucleotide adenylyltransferase [Elusimicrobium minutum]ACC98449.1 Nicotinate nucleotide adenylyltransferase family protein [Elusimicrobium minutum Pei191]
MKILYFGGSFDPVHRGHTALLKAAVKEIKPDIIHIIPAFHSPFKERSNTPFDLRMDMVRQAFKDIKVNIIFDNFEQRQNKKTFAWQNVEHIKKTYENPKIFMLVGTDALNDIPKWSNPEYLFKNVIVVAGKRVGLAAEEKLPFKYHTLKARLPRISSSQIRLEIMISGAASEELGPIKKIIDDNRLYFLNLHDWLKKNLKENRYLHSKAVSALAAQLALINEVYPERSALAALLHDCGKSMSPKELIAYCDKHNIRLPYYKEICENGPDLLHSFVSAHIAQHVFKITDEEILAAVREHTLGAVNMGVYSKILYVADTGSKDRKYKGAFTVRDLALKDLDTALVAATRMKLIFTVEAGKWLCPEGNIVWNNLVSKK